MSTARCVAADFHPSALADIYQPDIAMAIWQRNLEPGITRYAQHLMATSAHWQTRVIQTPQNIAQQLDDELPQGQDRDALITDVAQVVDMFSCLFELEHVGVRMAVLNRAMCPKFHVDRVPCRLISTYAGAGTQWHLPEQVERVEGAVMPHAKAQPSDLALGDVALLKGETWEGNEGRGLVHRSPAATSSTPRLVLTLDIV